MVDMEVFLSLERLIKLRVEPGEDPVKEASKVLDGLLEGDENLSSSLRTFEIYEREIEVLEDPLIFRLVKKLIDSFDPYFVHPDSYYEYDGESMRISKRIKEGMGIDEIADLMKDEFNWSFSGDFTREDFYYPAKGLVDLLETPLDLGSSSKIYEKSLHEYHIYVKILGSKLVKIPSSPCEEEEEKALEIAFKMGGLDSFKPSFSLVDTWAYRV